MEGPADNRCWQARVRGKGGGKPAGGAARGKGQLTMYDSWLAHIRLMMVLVVMSRVL